MDLKNPSTPTPGLSLSMWLALKTPAAFVEGPEVRNLPDLFRSWSFPYGISRPLSDTMFREWSIGSGVGPVLAVGRFLRCYRIPSGSHRVIDFAKLLSETNWKTPATRAEAWVKDNFSPAMLNSALASGLRRAIVLEERLDELRDHRAFTSPAVLGLLMSLCRERETIEAIQTVLDLMPGERAESLRQMTAPLDSNPFPWRKLRSVFFENSRDGLMFDAEANTSLFPKQPWWLWGWTPTSLW
jgi:hypothetical protein